MITSNRQWCVPYAAAIIERHHEGKHQLLIQTRWKPHIDPVYSGTLEFVAGTMDQPYENIYDMLRREIKEEVGLELKKIIDNSHTKTYTPHDDAAFGFRPFCCTQQLKGGLPWVGFIFRCEVEAGEALPQLEEVRDPVWMDADAVRRLFESSPERFFTAEVPAWEYYFQEAAA